MTARVLWRALVALACAAAAGSARADPVTFPGPGLTLSGEIMRPTGRGPFPAVVALHGCSGLYDSHGRLTARHADWGRRLTAEGFVVLFPDSFGSRGAPAQCGTADRVTRPAVERADDAEAARAWLQARPDVRPDKVALLGWSNGGSTVLYVSQRAPPEAGPGFVRAVAFYPGCRLPLDRRGAHVSVKLMILIGEADDWTPAEPCRALAAKAQGRGEPVSLITYPGAWHDFDAPDVPIHTVRGLAFTADGGGVAHTGADPQARADAIRRVSDYFKAP